MAKVLTNENMAQFIATGTIDEFKPPEAEKPAEVKAEEPKEAPKEEPKAEAAAEKPAESVEPEKDTSAEAEEDANLPEWAVKRINKKHREMKEAEEFAKSQYLERLKAEERAAELERQIAAKAEPAPEVKEPKQEDFTNVADYVQARVKWELRAEKEREAAERAEAESKAINEAHEKRIKAAMESIPDYQETIQKADVFMRMHLLEYIRQSEEGGKLSYYIAKHPDEAERLNKLPPIKAIAEMGKLELKVAEPKAPKVEEKPKVPVSKAPEPITPLDGKATPVQKRPEEMSFREIRELERQKRMQAQRR